MVPTKALAIPAAALLGFSLFSAAPGAAQSLTDATREMLKELKLDASILDVVGMDATNEQIFDREVLWKTKLGTRVKGLNRN